MTEELVKLPLEGETGPRELRCEPVRITIYYLTSFEFSSFSVLPHSFPSETSLTR